jgi:hypothetical protein
MLNPLIGAELAINGLQILIKKRDESSLLS